MKLKIDNIASVLKSDGEVQVNRESFDSDFTALSDYYVRNKDTESGPLCDLANAMDLLAFAGMYLSQKILNKDDGIYISEYNTDKVKISLS